MKDLKEQIFNVKESDGVNDLDLQEGEKIQFSKNGGEGIPLENLFRKHSFEGEELYGTSLLSYFTPTDGKLVLGKTVVELFVVGTSSARAVKVSEITRPLFTDDVQIDLEYITIFSELMDIENPEVVFADILEEEEKQALISARETKKKEATEKATKERNENIVAETAKADALIAEISSEEVFSELEAQEGLKYHDRIMALNDDLLPEGKKQNDIAVIKLSRAQALLPPPPPPVVEPPAPVEPPQPEVDVEAENKVREAINPDYLVTEAQYKEFLDFYVKKHGWKEFVLGLVHFFYSPDWEVEEEEPFVIVKRGTNFWEDVQAEIKEETDKRVVVEYKDSEEVKTIVLDTEKGEVLEGVSGK